MSTLNPQSRVELRQARFAGISGFLLATIIPLLSILIDYLFHISNPNTLGQFLAMTIISFLNATLIYFSFFNWTFGPQGLDHFAISQKFLNLREEKRVFG